MDADERKWQPHTRRRRHRSRKLETQLSPAGPRSSPSPQLATAARTALRRSKWGRRSRRHGASPIDQLDAATVGRVAGEELPVHLAPDTVLGLARYRNPPGGAPPCRTLASAISGWGGNHVHHAPPSGRDSSRRSWLFSSASKLGHLARKSHSFAVVCPEVRESRSTRSTASQFPTSSRRGTGWRLAQFLTAGSSSPWRRRIAQSSTPSPRAAVSWQAKEAACKPCSVNRTPRRPDRTQPPRQSPAQCRPPQSSGALPSADPPR